MERDGKFAAAEMCSLDRIHIDSGREAPTFEFEAKGYTVLESASKVRWRPTFHHLSHAATQRCPTAPIPPLKHMGGQELYDRQSMSFAALVLASMPAPAA